MDPVLGTLIVGLATQTVALVGLWLDRGAKKKRTAARVGVSDETASVQEQLIEYQRREIAELRAWKATHSAASTTGGPA